MQQFLYLPPCSLESRQCGFAAMTSFDVLFHYEGIELVRLHVELELKAVMLVIIHVLTSRHTLSARENDK